MLLYVSNVSHYQRNVSYYFCVVTKHDISFEKYSFMIRAATIRFDASKIDYRPFDAIFDS